MNTENMRSQLTAGELAASSSSERSVNLGKYSRKGTIKGQDTTAVVTDSESEDDYKKKPFFRVPSPGKTAKRTKRGSHSSATAYSTPPSPGSFLPPHNSGRRMSSEDIINQMEKEQDAMVMRLLKEIDLLRDENVRLRRSLNQLSSNLHLHSHDSGSAAGPDFASHLAPESARSSSSVSQLELQQLQQLQQQSANTADSRRPSSSSQLLDSLTPELQRKRNSVTKNDTDFMEGYSPTLRTTSALLSPNLISGPDYLPRRVSSSVAGSRRRRSSEKPADESDSSGSSAANSKIPKRAGSPKTPLTVAR